MVSLGSGRLSLGRHAPALGAFLSLIGGGLLLLNVLGSANGPLQPTASVDPSLPEYIACLQRGQEFDLDEATVQIYRGTIHSDDRRVSFCENWLQWTLGKVYPPLLRTQNSQRLVAGKMANCSERSQILKDLAENAGLPCRFVGLSGHVVLEVQTQRGWQVADPDYGIVYPHDVAVLQSPGSAATIRDRLTAAGHQASAVDHYIQIAQSAEDNVVLPTGSALSPRLDAIERACSSLAWMVPLGCLVAGLVLRLGIARPATERRPVLQASNPVACEI